MNKYRDFLVRATERAVKSAGQFGLAAFGATIFTDVDQVVSTASLVALAMGSGLVLSYLTSLASLPFGTPGTPSLVPDHAPLPPADE
jgi:hypothetical protein